MDWLPAADRGAVEAETLLKRLLVQKVCREGSVLPGAEEIDELDVHHPGPILLGEFKEFFRCHVQFLSAALGF
jgi:hypothetical protein